MPRMWRSSVVNLHMRRAAEQKQNRRSLTPATIQFYVNFEAIVIGRQAVLCFVELYHRLSTATGQKAIHLFNFTSDCLCMARRSM